MPPGSPYKNPSTHGLWNTTRNLATGGEVAYRIANQTSKCNGPQVLVARDAASAAFFDGEGFPPVPDSMLVGEDLPLALSKGTLVPTEPSRARRDWLNSAPERKRSRIEEEHDDPPSAPASVAFPPFPSLNSRGRYAPMKKFGELEHGTLDDPGSTDTLIAIAQTHAQLATSIQHFLDAATGHDGSGAPLRQPQPQPAAIVEYYRALRLLLKPLSEASEALSRALQAHRELPPSNGPCYAPPHALTSLSAASFPPSFPASPPMSAGASRLVSPSGSAMTLPQLPRSSTSSLASAAGAPSGAPASGGAAGGSGAFGKSGNADWSRGAGWGSSPGGWGSPPGVVALALLMGLVMGLAAAMSFARWRLAAGGGAGGWPASLCGIEPSAHPRAHGGGGAGGAAAGGSAGSGAPMLLLAAAMGALVSTAAHVAFGRARAPGRLLHGKVSPTGSPCSLIQGLVGGQRAHVASATDKAASHGLLTTLSTDSLPSVPPPPLRGMPPTPMPSTDSLPQHRV